LAALGGVPAAFLPKLEARSRMTGANALKISGSTSRLRKLSQWA
jgi:hypothetical protein